MCDVPAIRFPEFTGEWKIVKVGTITTKVGSGVTPRGGETIYRSQGHPFVRSQNVGWGRLLLNDIAYIDEETHKKQLNTALEQNDVLLNITGASIGRCAIVNEMIVNGNVNQHVCIIRSNGAVDSEFLCNYLLSNYGQKQIDSFQAGGNRQGLNFEQIKSIRISIPTLDEQKYIAKLLCAINQRIETQNKIIEKLETLIKGIRHKVFKQLRKDIGFNATIGNILSFEQPQRYIVSSAEYSNDDTFTPVLTANKAFILGYTTETDGIYGKGDCIIIDDFTLDCKYVSFPFKVKSSAIKILTAKNKFILRYAYEYLKLLELSTEEHKRHYIAEVQPHSCVLPDENTLKTIALVFENLACKLANEQSLVLIFNKQKQYLLSKMFI